jgi:ergothioneine biosynthesis protein EgtB
VGATSIGRPIISLAERFTATRRRTLALCKPLTAEDMMVQSCAEASPAKWHLAHTAWFFESFVLREFIPGYRLFNLDFPWLFNSYYQSFSAIPEKRLRASFSRPGLEEVLRFREHVARGMDDLFERLAGDQIEPALAAQAAERIELGVNHEEQHQELLLTDILHAFSTNPLRPAYLPAGFGLGDPGLTPPRTAGIPASSFHDFPGGIREAGSSGPDFCFDNERPLHRVWLDPYRLADRMVTCAEYAAFIADGGYRRPELWLSAGWDTVRASGWAAPLYWTDAGKSDGAGSGSDWRIFTLRGELPLASLEDTPVSQVSFFEADAYARWAGLRLPTEFEWEAAAGSQAVIGNLLDSEHLLPAPAERRAPSSGPAQLFGDCWEWTSSAYLGYPGFKPLPGSLGEYNGKFMSGQMVLRGGSCVTPAAHIRASYRNFFPPETRWQFSGIRLAR